MSYLGIQPLQTSLAIIEEGSITTGKIANSAVTTPKLSLSSLDVSQTQNTRTRVKVANPDAGTQATSGVLFGTSSGDTGYIGTNGGAASSAIGGASALQVTTLVNGPIVLAPNVTERVRVETSGRVLIGANAGVGAQLLQIYGANTDASLGIKRHSNDASAGYVAVIKTRGTNPTDLTVVQPGDALGSYVFGATQGTGTVSVIALDGSIDSVGTVNATSLPTILTIGTTPDGSILGVERIRIKSNGDTGVGTNSPPARLSARGRGTTANTYGFSVQDLNSNYNLLVADDGSITSANVASAVGYKGTPLNEQSASYTLTPTDQGKSIVHPATDNNARTFTIPSNANVAYPVGTALTFINMANTVTIAIAADVMYLAGAGTTGSRTLAAYGMASALKLTSNTWIISGNGLT